MVPLGHSRRLATGTRSRWWWWTPKNIAPSSSEIYGGVRGAARSQRCASGGPTWPRHEYAGERQLPMRIYGRTRRQRKGRGRNSTASSVITALADQRHLCGFAEVAELQCVNVCAAGYVV